MAGSDAGHAFASLGLAADFAAAGDETVVYTGERWTEAAARRGLTVRPLPGLAARPGEDDGDAGAKLSTRAARMAVELAPLLAVEGYDLVISDSITLAGGWAAELAGIPWIELSSHPLYDQSRGLPPIGSGLDVGIGVCGRSRDRVLRWLSRSAEAKGRRQRRAARTGIGLEETTRPIGRFVATLPGLEVPRPDWPAEAAVVGPLFFEPTDDRFPIPGGPGPLVVVCPSTAESGSAQLSSAALGALADLQREGPVRVVYSALEPPEAAEVPEGLVAGLGRQDRILEHADLVICGGGHGMLAKALSVGLPVLTVPGGGDQWELACRVQRTGAGELIRPVSRKAIAAAVRRMLGDPSYAAAAAVIAAGAAEVTEPVALAHRLFAEHAAPHRADGTGETACV